MAENVVGFNVLSDSLSVSAYAGMQDVTNGTLAANSSLSEGTTSPHASREGHQDWTISVMPWPGKMDIDGFR